MNHSYNHGEQKSISESTTYQTLIYGSTTIAPHPVSQEQESKATLYTGTSILDR